MSSSTESAIVFETREVSFYSFDKESEDLELEHESVTSLIADKIADTEWCSSPGNTMEKFSEQFSPLTVYGYCRKKVLDGSGEESIDIMLDCFDEDRWAEPYGGECSPPWNVSELEVVKGKLYAAMQECIDMAYVYQCDRVCEVAIGKDLLLEILREDLAHLWNKPKSKTKFELEKENHDILRSKALIARPNDTISHAIGNACKRYSGPACDSSERDGVFNAACFSNEFCQLAGVKGPIDGIVVRAMLNGRADVLFHDGSDAYYTWLGE